MITIENISKKYDEKMVLAPISFHINPGEKIALAGSNGVGKSTLMKIIAGDLDSDSGDVRIRKNFKIAYLPQKMPMDTGKTVLGLVESLVGIDVLRKEMEAHKPDSEEYYELMMKFSELDGYTFSVQLAKFLSGFGLNDFENRNYDDLSLGQKTKVYLSALLLQKAHCLLLDEPTNNLDIAAIEWLEFYLSQKKNLSCLIISHDIRLLDTLTNKVIYIDWQTREAQIVRGNYSDLLGLLDRKRANQEIKFQNSQQEKKRISKEIQSLKQKTEKGSRYAGKDNDKFHRGFKRDKAGKSGKRVKALSSQLEQMEDVERPLEKRSVDLEIAPSSLHFSLSLEKAAVKRGSFSLSPVDMYITPGKKIAIVGENGSGKSTLFSLLKGQLETDSGKRVSTGNILIADYSQSLEDFPKDKTALEYFEKYTKDPSRIYYLASKYGLEKSSLSREIQSLSFGQRARLLYIEFTLSGSNILLLDEPTNHLDIESQMALRAAISSFPGACLVITHDRKLLEGLEYSDVFEMKDGVLSSVSDIHDYISRAREKAQKMNHTLK